MRTGTWIVAIGLALAMAAPARAGKEMINLSAAAGEEILVSEPTTRRIPGKPAPEPQVHEPAVDPAIVAYARAQQRIARAGREGRSLDERIGDLELALQELKDLDATATAQMISQVERDLERLQLEREFFGSPEPD